MNSKERHQLRYLRRKARREQNKNKLAVFCDNFERVFSYNHLYKSYKKCCLGVGWKASTQLYRATAPLNVYKTYVELHNGTFKSDGFFEFNLLERGKLRRIRSVTIRERVVQKCLCDYCLTPMLGRTLIYDNGASSKGKGYTFAINRLKKHLMHHYRLYGNSGYILLFDFSKFFDHIEHWLIENIISREIKNIKIKTLAFHFINMFGERGIGLGSQISQNLALSSVNKLDHYMKDVLSFKGYARYMDDGYIISNSKEKLENARAALFNICNELGIEINKNKTRIEQLNKGFTFLKIRFYLTASGKILRKPWPKTIVRQRRKIKKFANLIAAEKMTWFDAWQSFQSWRSHLLTLNAYKSIVATEQLFYKLIGLQPSLI